MRLLIKYNVHNHDIVTHAGICVGVMLLFNLMGNCQQGRINWNQFRGPNGQGFVEADNIPVHFGPDSNVLWKTAISPGHSSPVIWNDQVFLTAYKPSVPKELITLSINRKNGKILWSKVVQAEHKARFHSMNTPATPTPAVDEKHVYVYFGTYGLLCYDHNGEKTWERKLYTPKSQYGVASSPILYKDMVILVIDDNGGKSRLLAVNGDTGKTAWEEPRPMFRAGWSTPMIWHHGDVDELVVLGFKRLTSYNPSTGDEIWWAGGFSIETVGVPVTGEGLLFSSSSALGGFGDEKRDNGRTWKITVEEFDKNNNNQIERSEMTKKFTVPLRPELSRDNPGYGLPVWSMDGLLRFFDKNKDRIITEAEWMQTMSGFNRSSEPTLLAIRPGATKNARKSHVAWEFHRGIPETSSLLYCRGRLYLVRDGGLLTCLKASNGKELFRKRIRAPGQYTASPVAAGDKVIFASRRGVVTVIQADNELKILAKNSFKEKIYATPAIYDNKIYLRTTGHLYAFGL